MKKMIFSLILVTGITANAGLLNFFNFSKFFEAALVAGEGVAQNLEKVRLKQHAVMDIREQWDQACVVTQTLNPSLKELNKLLAEKKVNSEFCAPITTVIKFQSDMLMRCQGFYSKPVPDNAEFILGKFALSVFQTKMILTKCYPILKRVKIPGLPGMN